MALVCGIDEAGRGPILGPLVIAAAVMDESGFDRLRNMGVKDSKLLTPLQRERISEELRTVLHSFRIIELAPAQVDAALDGDGTNLNWLELDNALLLINELNPEQVIIDSPSNNIKAVKHYVMTRMHNKLTRVIVEHKADVNHVIVGAASILAKVTRDERILEIKKRIGLEIGSGYLTDPLTQAFMNKYWQKYPEIFRKSWKPYKALVARQQQKGLGGF